MYATGCHILGDQLSYNIFPRRVSGYRLSAVGSTDFSSFSGDWVTMTYVNHHIGYRGGQKTLQ